MTDTKLAGLLSDFFLDIAKAFFIQSFITTAFIKGGISEYFLIWTRGILNAILFIGISRVLLEFKK